MIIIILFVLLSLFYAPTIFTMMITTSAYYVFPKVHQQLQMLYKMEGLHAATMSELSAICSRLGASRLLLVEGSRRDLHRRIRLNISQDDIIFALRDSTH